MKLSIASREGAVSEDEARELAWMIAEEAKSDDWIRVLYAVDTTTVEVLSFAPVRERRKAR